jgi:type I restriction enzyme M protein
MVSTGNNFNYASFVWGIADRLRGTYKRHEYGKVILPFVVLRRLDCTLEATKKQVLVKAKGLKSKDASRDFLLQKVSGYSFYNTSPYDLQKILGDPSNLKANLQAYIAGFSSNLQDVFERYDFDTQIARLEESDLLLLITQEFLKIDLHPEVIDNAQMGHIFEELIAKAMEASNEEAGEYFTPRDVVRLMVNLLFSRDDKALSKTGIVRSIYDPTAGTGGMLSVAEDHIRELNPDAQLTLYGQERNAESYAIAKTDLLIKGQSADNMYFGDTLTNDGHWDKTFDYGLANPPFGVEWSKQQEFIFKEYENRGFNGRFGAGLPRVSDGSLLFLMHLVNKMRPATEGGGRIGIVLNGSPLSTGAAGSGESEIRRWLLENDLVEAIIGLPRGMFYNTGIATYIWLLDNDKPNERRGKIQLIDATNQFQKLRKNVGEKRNELTSENINTIVHLYDDFEENDYSRIFTKEDFEFTTITIEQPLRLNWALTPERIDLALKVKTFEKLGALKLDEIRKKLISEAEVDNRETVDREIFEKRIKKITNQFSLTSAQLKALLLGLSERDLDAPVVMDAKNNPVPDVDLRDTENVPLSRDIDDYVATEIAPHLQNFWVDRSKDKIGCEISFTRQFFKYVASRPINEIDTELSILVKQISLLLNEVKK